ncbi:MAG: Hpt domain-containing protein [Bacteroidales bacterium]|nr:Hpt domain-containing protein [Bacteroidales bacterium]
MDNTSKYDLSFLNKISNGDKEFILEMVTAFQEAAPVTIEKLENSLKNKNYVSIAREAHRFIPGISFLGVKHIENDLLKIEDYSKKMENLDQLPELINNVKKNIFELTEQFKTDFNLKE